MIPFVVASVLNGLLYLLSRPLSYPFADDAGIVLRYLDNFRAGHFYTYNIPDGPVFGVSGFAHGLLAGGLAYFGVRPELALVVSNAVGTELFFVFVMLIWKELYGSNLVACLLTVALALSSKYIALTFYLGLEPPIHLAIVAWGFWLFVRKSPFLYLACAAIIVSKLDAVGLAGCLLFGRALQVAVADKPKWSLEIRRFFTLFVLPMALWIGFTMIVFGSPIPQTFIAKLFYHPKSSGSRFPFLSVFMEGKEWMSFIPLLAFGALMIVVGVVAVRRRRPIPLATLCALAGMSCLAEYYLYNPGERMTWYYTLPEVLFLMSLFAGPAAFTSLWPRLERPLRAPVAVLAIFVVFSRASLGFVGVGFLHQYQLRVEAERIRVGEFVRDITPPAGLVYAGHGHIARESRRNVLDVSGLNSRLATHYKLDLEALFAAAPPATLAETWLLPDWVQRKNHLRLRGSFYDISRDGAMAWRVFSVDPAWRDTTSLLSEDEITPRRKPGEQLIAPNIVFDLSKRGPITRIAFGVALHHESTVIHVELKANGVTQTGSCVVAGADPVTCQEFCTRECQLELTPARKLDQMTLSSSTPLHIIEPTVAAPYPP